MISEVLQAGPPGRRLPTRTSKSSSRNVEPNRPAIPVRTTESVRDSLTDFSRQTPVDNDSLNQRFEPFNFIELLDPYQIDALFNYLQFALNMTEDQIRQIIKENMVDDHVTQVRPLTGRYDGIPRSLKVPNGIEIESTIIFLESRGMTRKQIREIITNYNINNHPLFDHLFNAYYSTAYDMTDPHATSLHNNLLFTELIRRSFFKWAMNANTTKDDIKNELNNEVIETLEREGMTNRTNNNCI